MSPFNVFVNLERDLWPRPNTKSYGGPSQKRVDVTTYLHIHDVAQVQRLLDDVHEGLPQHLAHENVGHGQETVGAERLDQQQLVHRLANHS